MKGKRIKTLQQILNLGLQKKALYYERLNYRMPAAFALNMSGLTILRLIDKGLYVYKAKGKHEQKD